MAKEVKKAVCEWCHAKCRVLVHSENGRLVTFDDATHWVMHDKPSQVSQLLIEHFSV